MSRQIQRFPGQVQSKAGEAEVARWRQLVEEQARSGQTQEAFCKERCLPFHRFHYWKYEKLPEIGAGCETSRPDTALPVPIPVPSFVPVEVVRHGRGSHESRQGDDHQDSGIEVLLADGVRIGIRRDFDAGVLRRVVEVLGC